MDVLRSIAAAPVCVARGTDLVALRIREIATGHSAPIVANPPLARAQHATIGIDEEIPTEHDKGVAEVIGDVMKLSRAAGEGISETAARRTKSLAWSAFPEAPRHSLLRCVAS